MGAPRFCVSSGECCHGTAGGLYCWSVPTATRRAVMCTVGSGTARQDGQTELGASIGDAARVLGCATHRKVAICVRALCFGHSETCRVLSCGFLSRSHPSMIPVSTSCVPESPLSASKGDPRHRISSRSQDASEKIQRRGGVIRESNDPRKPP
jgi:hypothetical protein